MGKRVQPRPDPAPAEAIYVNTAAKQCGASYAACWRWVLSGQVPHWGEGSTRLVLAADVLRVLQRHRQLAVAKQPRPRWDARFGRIVYPTNARPGKAGAA